MAVEGGAIFAHLAGVHVETVLDQEVGLQTATQIFRALEAQTTAAHATRGQCSGNTLVLVQNSVNDAVHADRRLGLGHAGH